MFIEANKYNTAGTEEFTVTVNDTYDDGDDVQVSLTVESDEVFEDGETVEITMKKSGKSFLFFPSWKVDASQYYCSDAEFITYSSMDVYVNGEKLDDDFIDSDDDYEKTYIIPHMFNGTYEVACGLDDVMGASTSVAVTYDDCYTYCEDFDISADMLQDACDTAHSDFQTIVDALVTGQSFDSISDIYTEDEVDDAEDDYDYEIGDYSDYYAWNQEENKEGITDVSIDYFEFTDYDQTISNGKIRVDLYFDYDYTLLNLDYDYGYDETIQDWKYTPVQEQISNDYDGCIELVYEDGEWMMNYYYTPYFSTYSW